MKNSTHSDPVKLNGQAEAAVLAPAFQNPVDAAQESFRAILDTMSRPGTIKKMAQFPQADFSLSKSTLAVALTLLDADTPYWFSEKAQQEGLRNYLAFHTGAPFEARVEEAQFLFVSHAEDIPDLMSLKPGTAEYPDRSATLIIEIGEFGSGTEVELSGPGIRTTTRFSASALTDAFWRDVQKNAARFPLGVDFIFTSSDGSVAALPRSTQVRF